MVPKRTEQTGYSIHNLLVGKMGLCMQPNQGVLAYSLNPRSINSTRYVAALMPCCCLNWRMARPQPLTGGQDDQQPLADLH